MADAIETSRDTFKARFVDAYTNATTGADTETAIDLSAASTIKLRYRPQWGGDSAELSLTADGDQVNNTGYASGEWGTADLSEGDYEGQCSYLDGSSKLHVSEAFYFHVGALLPAPP